MIFILFTVRFIYISLVFSVSFLFPHYTLFPVICKHCGFFNYLLITYLGSIVLNVYFNSTICVDRMICRAAANHSPEIWDLVHILPNLASFNAQAYYCSSIKIVIKFKIQKKKRKLLYTVSKLLKEEILQCCDIYDEVIISESSFSFNWEQVEESMGNI